MAEPSVYMFELKEVVEALARKQGITSGRWTVGFELNFAATIAGPTPEQTRPTAVMQINKMTLQQAEPQTPQHMVFEFDAPKGPARSTKKTKA